MAEPVAVVQLCPNDHPPFRELCTFYERAVAANGQRAVTVFFAPPTGEPLPGATYLDLADLRPRRALGARVRSALAKPGAPVVGADAPVRLALCHRYRALQGWAASGLAATHTVCVAHEFGMFARRQRRWRRRLLHDEVVFAGVSAPVVAELERVGVNATLLPNGVDLERLSEKRLDRDAARERLALDGGEFNIGVVGRLHPKKRPDLALAGYTEFVRNQANATLTFLGDGELMDSLVQAAAGQRVNFAGFLAGAARYLPAFDVLVIPSGEREAFNMVALEAMAAGIPVVAGPSPGPRFVLGDVGVYFDSPSPVALADALVRVTTLDVQDLAQQARQRVQESFSVPATARRLERWLGVP